VIKKTVAVLVFAACAALGLPARGQQQPQRSGTPPQIEPDTKSLRPPPGQRMADADVFKLLDANSDGIVSAAEWRERKMALFYLLDADNDIYLERREVPGMSQEAFMAADLDQDGRLSGFEFNQATFTQFETADLDRAGTVTFEQFEQYRKRIAGP
jgi:Ca2+-binding EF-hand superfamily protein